MFFRKNYAAPGPGIDPDEPEKTGMARFAEILSLECTTLLKLNLLLLLCAVPVVTLPPALYAMHCVVRKMILDQPVDCFYDFKTAFRRHWKRGYAAFFLVAAPLGLSGCGVWFYLGRALEYPLFFLPFMLCSTVFLAALLSSCHLYGLLGAGRGVRESFRLALLLGLGRPLRAVLAALCWYGSLFTAVMAFPLSGAYLLLIGFSVPCLLGNFFLRTVLKPYCPPVSE